MQIDRVNPAHAAAMSKAKHANKAKKDDMPEKTQASEASEKGHGHKAHGHKSHGRKRGKGMLGLLAEGHFKGVADVRLRINFHDQIQAMKDADLRQTAGESFETFNGSIEGGITALKDSEQLSDEQLAALTAFEENLGTAQSDFLDSKPLSIEGLMGSLQTEFDALAGVFISSADNTEDSEGQEGVEVAAAEVIEETDPAEAPAETPVADESVILAPGVEEVPEETSVLDLFNALQDSFNAAKDNLESELNSAHTLPEISSPHGKGRAFEKFLAIYEQMQNGTDVDVEESEILDFEEIIVDEDVEEPAL